MSDKSSHHLQKQFLGRGCVDEPSLQKNNPPNPRTPIFTVENSCLHWCELLSCRRPGGKCKPSLATLNLGVRGCAAPVINSWGHCEKWCELLSHYSTPGGSQSAPPKRTDRQRACPWSPTVEPRVQNNSRTGYSKKGDLNRLHQSLQEQQSHPSEILCFCGLRCC